MPRAQSTHEIEGGKGRRYQLTVTRHDAISALQLLAKAGPLLMAGLGALQRSEADALVAILAKGTPEAVREIVRDALSCSALQTADQMISLGTEDGIKTAFGDDAIALLRATAKAFMVNYDDFFAEGARLAPPKAGILTPSS